MCTHSSSCAQNNNQQTNESISDPHQFSPALSPQSMGRWSAWGSAGMYGIVVVRLASRKSCKPHPQTSLIQTDSGTQYSHSRCYSSSGSKRVTHSMCLWKWKLMASKQTQSFNWVWGQAQPLTVTAANKSCLFCKLALFMRKMLQLAIKWACQVFHLPQNCTLKQSKVDGQNI